MAIESKVQEALFLTSLGESVFAAMADKQREALLSHCDLLDSADREYVANVPDFASCEVSLESFGGKRFDGASRVDVIVRLGPGVAAAFELKLGVTRLTKKRIDGEWLQCCETSHGGRRWAGSMMAILDRRFPGPIADDLFVKTEDGETFRLLRDWFVVARQETLDAWKLVPPNFGAHVKQIAIETVVQVFGGKVAFNELMRRKILEMDFYEKWIARPKGIEKPLLADEGGE